MCGISGVFLKPNETAGVESLQAMARAMRRRGPDSEGVFASGRVGLAHRRLRIIDLSEQAAQPMFDAKSSADARIAVVFNGEIYNFRELREELEKLGHSFRSRSDTEVIVRSYEQWGCESFARFNGIFALGIWDARGERPLLRLARDRFGTKPLFYALQGGRFAFASELKPLLGLAWLERTVDPESLFHFLKFSHVPNPRSILRGVAQLPPGHLASYDGEKLELRVFREPLDRAAGEGSPPGLPALPALPALNDERSWLERLDRTLLDCVRRQLVSDVPVGCFLSGGIDSSLLALAHSELAASGFASGPVRTFTIGYREREFDETAFAREVAEACGTEHHELVVGPRDFIELIPEVPELFDQPFADPTLLSSLLLSRFAREKVTVALSGDGGDELFFGYAQQYFLLRLERLAGIPRAIRSPIARQLGLAARSLLRLGAENRRVHQSQKLSEILQYKDRAELFQYFIGTIGPMRLDKIQGLIREPSGDARPVHGPLVESLRALPAEERISELFVRTFLVDTVLAKTDRASMAYGLEARVPLLDDAMVRFSAELPFKHKLRGRSSKHLLRKLLESKLSARGLSTSLSRRPKQGFSIPLKDWLKGELKYLLDEYLHPSRLEREGVFDSRRVHGLVREHLRYHANHSHVLWSLVSFQMWKERYLP